ncbi:MAG: T9SS type A sorting domain-containing protein [Flavitalea sp.]
MFTNIRHLLILIICWVNTYESRAQNLALDWVNTFAGGGGIRMQIDSNKYVIVSGDFSGTKDFDPGPGVFNLTALQSCTFVAKYTIDSGRLVWARQFGDRGFTVPEDITLDGNGNLLVMGYFDGPFDADPGPGEYPLYSVFGARYLVKINSHVNFIWAKVLVGGFQKMTIDSQKDIIISGEVAGIKDFDPGPDTFMLGHNDRYFYLAILKLDTDGNFVWAREVRNLGTKDLDVRGIKTDQSDGIIISGYTETPLDFDPGPDSVKSTMSGFRDGFIFKLDKDGNFSWYKRLASNSSVNLSALTLDSAGNIYTTGSFGGQLFLGDNPAVFLLNSNAPYSCFITKIDNNGNLIYCKQLESTTGYSMGNALAIDAQDNLYIAGDFNGNIDFDPGPNVFHVPEQGECYVLKLDATGNFLTVRAFSSTRNTQSLRGALETDILQNVYYTRTFSGTMDFDPGPDQYFVSEPDGGTFDYFIVKLREGNKSISYYERESCVPINVNNINYSKPGTYFQKYVNSAGEDSILQIAFRRPFVRTSVSVTSCGSYKWNNRTLTTSGLYRDTLTGITVCDSIVSLRLTISNIATEETRSACGSYNWNGKILSASGTYTDTIHLAGGCDSIITLNLLINEIPDPKLGRDTMFCNGDNLFLSPGSFAKYNWSTGSASSNIYVVERGTYWVTVTNAGNCSASDTINIAKSQDCDCSSALIVKVYPVPFNDYLYFEKSASDCVVKVSLFSINGQPVVSNFQLSDRNTKLPLYNLSKGIYLYRLYVDGKEFRSGKVMKQ